MEPGSPALQEDSLATELSGEPLDSVLKSRDITTLTKVCLVKAMVFLVVRYRCKSWILKKAEHWRIDAFELWCWGRHLRVPWTARTSQSKRKSTLKDWCWSSNTLATGCEELTCWKKPWCWERLKARGEGDDRGWDGWMASLTQWTWVLASSGRWWRAGKPGVLLSTGSQRVGHDLAAEQKQQLNHCMCVCVCVCVCSLSCVWLFVTPWTVAHQAPLSMGFFRQKYWRGLPFPPQPRDWTCISYDSCIGKQIFIATEPSGQTIKWLQAWPNFCHQLNIIKYILIFPGSFWKPNEIMYLKVSINYKVLHKC